MGNEVRCAAVIDGVAAEGKALLETREIVFRSEAGRLAIRFEEIDVAATRAKDGVLEVRFGARRRARFELGDKAAKWLEKIKNPPSRLDKLGIKPGMRVGLVGLADEELLAELKTRTDDVTVGRPRSDSDVLFLGAERRAELDKLGKLQERLKPEGAIWVVRRKGATAGVTEADSMAEGKAAGLVDVKVVAYSATHTAEKYVIPVAARRGR